MSLFRRKLLESYATNKLVYPGLIAAWSAKGKTNDDADRATLKDLTGNGHDITLNNFAYSGMSGYGGYNVNFLTFGTTSSNLKEKTSTKIIVNGRVGGYIYYIHPINEVPSFKIKISGLVTDYAYVDENNIRQVIRIKEGEHILPKSYASDTITTLCGFMNPITSESTENGIIELIPEYPDALVFDGVDDFGLNKDIPILTDYTVIFKRKVLNNSQQFTSACGNLHAVNANKDYYWFEYSSMTFSFGGHMNIKGIIPELITWQSKQSYNGYPINSMTIESYGNKFTIASLGWRNYKNMAFYSAYLFDMSLDEQEIKSFIRKHIDPEYLLPSEILTPDVYYDFTNGDNSKGEANNVIKDLSGNGNDATAHNFAWNEESGYAEGGGLKFDSVDDYIALNNTNNTNIYYNTTILLVKPVGNGTGSFFDQRYAYNIVSKYTLTLAHAMAYTITNDNGLVYINGKEQYLNSTLLYNKKHNVTVVNSTINKTQFRSSHIMIGTNVAKSVYADITVYKILLFRESLTEEQIKAVINKYNLLDGVDNIN